MLNLDVFQYYRGTGLKVTAVKVVSARAKEERRDKGACKQRAINVVIHRPCAITTPLWLDRILEVMLYVATQGTARPLPISYYVRKSSCLRGGATAGIKR